MTDTPSPPTLNASLRQLTGKLNPQPVRGTGIIKHVNYTTRRIAVTLKGFGVLRDVLVQEGIQLGTTDRPVVNASDLADLHIRPLDNRWICTAIHQNKKCATHTLGISPDVEVENSLESADSYTVQQLSALETPYDLRIPPFELLGQLTPPAFRFPDPTIYLCGIPQCTVCAPDGYTVGMSLILSTDDDHPFCWVWGFRRAPCDVVFHSQGAIYDAQPDATYVATGDIVVAVREHYAYVALRGRHTTGTPPSSFETSLLQTWDLSDPAAPVKVDEQGLTSATGTQYGDMQIGVYADTLWVSGFQLDYVHVTDTLGKTVKRYDISTRSAPSLATEWSTNFYPNWVPFVNFVDGVFTGQPYLVGFNWQSGSRFQRFVVEDGLVGGEIASLAGDYNSSLLGDISAPVVCDNTVLVTKRVAPSSLKVEAIDLTTVASPVVLWDDTGMAYPLVHLGSNKAYVKSTSGSEAEYTNLNASATRSAITPPTTAHGDFGRVPQWGWFLNHTCLFRANFVPNAEVFDITDELNPSRSATSDAPILTVQANNDARFSASDIEGTTVYMCTVGVHQESANVWKDYLTVFTNKA